jgi:hypothetical protein
MYNMDIKKSIEKILPQIEQISTPLTNALGMPYAGVIIAALCHSFGVKTPEKLPKAIANDTQAATKIKEIEAQIASLQATTANPPAAHAPKDSKDWIVHYLALSVSMGFFGYIIAFQSGAITFDKEIFHNLVVMLTIVLMYYF